MSFSDFKTISQVQQLYQIHYQEAVFIPVKKMELSSLFVEEIAFNINQLDVFSSEAARCELLILPVLREVYKQYAQQFSLWVQKSINYTPELSGTPDYMISKRSALGKTVLEFPLLMLVEAKKNDFEQGWAQCLAELWAAQQLNKNPQLTVYGIVSDGKYWEFGQLTGQMFIKNSQSFVIDDLAELLSALRYVFEQVNHA
ncbi:MAG: hypothetical protein H6996_03990 [Moraxellaceae bacterium]|nr:hypothetical protein [Pseudomonadales bacterium]MCP5174252.1 hypothetical protein [Moraxellaceae bacterium]MCP5176694.1 hypothetical protein [Moraxellaceae bacterium]HQV23804.1 hypothetical protein [Agitococcus sp.]